MLAKNVPVFDSEKLVAIAQVFTDENSVSVVGLVTTDLESDWSTGDEAKDEYLKFVAVDSESVEVNHE